MSISRFFDSLHSSTRNSRSRDLYIYNIIRPIAHVLCSLCLDTNHNSDLSCGPMFDIVPDVTEYFS